MTIASGTCGSNLNWVINDDYSLVITGSGAMNSYSISPPSSKVPWYSYASQITSVSLPEGLTDIATGAFSGSYKLATIKIPSTVTTIRSTAFWNNTGLTSIEIPASVKNIASQSFDGCYNVTSITLFAVPLTIGSTAFSLGTSSHSATCVVKSPNNVANNALESYKGSYTTFTYEGTTLYRPFTYVDSKIRVDSAIRDGNGVRIDTNYQRKPAVYERTTQSSTSTVCTLIQFNASDYKANGYLAHFRFRVRSILQDAYPSDNEFIINYSYFNPSMMCTNNKKTTTNNIVQNIYAYYPNSNSYLDTGNYFIAFRTGRASTNFIIEMIEADVPYTIPATMSASTTTNILYQSLSPGNYSSGTPLMWTDTAAGNISGNAATAVNSTYAHGTKQMYFRVGESDTFKLMAVDHTGVAYKINTSTKKFPLPISMYVGTGDGANATSNNGQTSISGSQGYTNVSYLTGSSYNGFTMPTLTASDGGKTLYIRGSLDADGYFVCDGNVTLSMEAGYTYIPFGTLNPKYIGATAQTPTSFSFNAISVSAYTLDANGKLTHIDGKPVGGGGSMEAAYPIGSIYMNASNSTNPSTLLGFGTWQELAPGRVLMGAGTDSVITGAPTYSAGDTVGEYDHTLTTTEMPSHGHSVSVSSTDTNHVHGFAMEGAGGFSGSVGKFAVDNGQSAGSWPSASGVLGVSSDGGACSQGSQNRSATISINVGNHTHGGNTTWVGQNGSWQQVEGWGSPSHTHSVNQSNAGGGGAHNNIQPSLVVYMWVRTA